jgi:glycosyltransferase involved in cell wall biosynthesis
MSGAMISVVIPTYNRKELLCRSLRALQAQTLAKEQFEVVVVDDGGSDDSEQAIQEFAAVLNIKFFWQKDEGFRAGKARNIGTAIADGKYIVYLDSGVLPATATLQEHLRVHEQSEHPTVIIGYVYGFEVDNDLVDRLPPHVDPGDVDGTIRRLRELQALDIRQRQYDLLGEDIGSWPAPFDIMWTCHVSAEREELLRAGLFDERFNTWGGEDVDLGVRLFLNKNLFLLCRSATSFHWPTRKDTEDLKEKSAVAAQKIHRKYKLWETSYYGMGSADDKYSLNKVIRDMARFRRSGS